MFQFHPLIKCLYAVPMANPCLCEGAHQCCGKLWQLRNWRPPKGDNQALPVMLSSGPLLQRQKPMIWPPCDNSMVSNTENTIQLPVVIGNLDTRDATTQNIEYKDYKEPFTFTEIPLPLIFLQQDHHVTGEPSPRQDDVCCSPFYPFYSARFHDRSGVESFFNMFSSPVGLWGTTTT